MIRFQVKRLLRSLIVSEETDMISQSALSAFNNKIGKQDS